MEERTHSSSTAGYLTGHESHSSGVSWAAVIGGAFVTAALSLILLALGTGFGFSSVSPWSNVGASASTVGTSAIVRSEEHTSELQSLRHLVCRLLLEKKKLNTTT